MNTSNIAAPGSITAASTTSKASGPGGLKETPKEAFLHLLVAQLEHQNPLAPMENTEFTAQLAQFTSLEQLQTANTNLNALMNAQTTANGLQAAALIGKQVQAQGSSTQIDQDGKATPFHYTLARETASVQITVTDKTGTPLRTLNIGSQKAGVQDTRWDGKNDQGQTLPEGDYHFTVTAEDKAGRPVPADISLTGTVDSITYVDQKPYLVVGGKQVELGDLTRVHQTK